MAPNPGEGAVVSNLQSKLDEIKRQFSAQMPDVAARLGKATQELVASGIAGQALRQGERAPDFHLPDATGKMVRLSDLLRQGPAVVTFYRGVW